MNVPEIDPTPIRCDNPPMRTRGRGVMERRTGRGRHAVGAARMSMWGLVMVSGLLGAGMLGGCVTVNAPNKPIVIELNINIKQEVIYRLAADAGKTIDSNKEIF